MKSFLDDYSPAVIMDPMDPVQIDIGRNIKMDGVITLVYPEIDEEAIADGTAARTQRRGMQHTYSLVYFLRVCSTLSQCLSSPHLIFQGL
jgi:hypothetical protein